MRHRSLVLLTAIVPGLIGGAAADAAAKKRAKCAPFYEQKGCKLPLGSSYSSRSNGARVTIYDRGFNISDLVVAKAPCSDGSTVRFTFTVRTADVSSTTAVRIGQTQKYIADSTDFQNGDDQFPVRFDGSVTFTSARKATLRGTVSAQLPTDSGVAKDCRATVQLKLKRSLEV